MLIKIFVVTNGKGTIMFEFRFKDGDGNVLEETFVLDMEYILSNEFLKEYFAEEFYRKVCDKVDFVEMISVEEFCKNFLIEKQKLIV